MTQTFCRFHWTATVVAMVAVGLSALSPSISQVRPATFSSQTAAVKEDLSPSAKPKGYSVRWVPGLPEARTATVQVSGLSLATLKALQNPRWSLGRLEARAGSLCGAQEILPSSPDHPPMLGRYRIQDGLLSFEPQFPLDPGVAYRAEFRPDQLPGAQSSKGAPHRCRVQASGNESTGRAPWYSRSFLLHPTSRRTCLSFMFTSQHR